MYKIAILGCENSHADGFLNAIKNQGLTDIEVVGVYSEYEGAGEKLSKAFNVPALKSYDECVNKIDGLVITARHGDNHFKYAKPYIESGIPMFIDKPITVSVDDANEFKSLIKKHRISVTGGSMCIYADYVKELKTIIASGENGRITFGTVGAPINMVNDYGNFYFYSQHLVHVMCELFGYYPKSVKTFTRENSITAVFRYEDFDVTGVYQEGSNLYFAGVGFLNGFVGSKYELTDCSVREFNHFYKILKGEAPSDNVDTLFAPVSILNAIDRAIKSGNEEKIIY